LINLLKFIQETFKRRDFRGEILPLSCGSDDFGGFVGILGSNGDRGEGITSEHFPMIENALRESLSRSVLTQISSESERLHNGQMGFDVLQVTTGLVTDDGTTTSVEDTIDTTDSDFGASDFDEVDRLHDTRLGSQLASIVHTTRSRDDLTTTTMDSVSMKSNVQESELDTTHVLIAKNTFFRGPLEGSNARVFDFVEVSNSLGLIDQQVSASGLRAEAPDLLGISGVPAVFVDKGTTSDFGVVFDTDGTGIDFVGKIISEGLASHEESVVLVGRLGETSVAGFSSDGFSVGDNGISHLQFNTSEFFSEILQADFEMELTSTSDDVFTAFFGVALDAGIGLRQTFETFNQFGEIRGVLWLDGNTHDRGHTELHDTDVVGLFGGGDGSGLNKVLIDTD